MNQIRQHRPAFFEGYENQTSGFETTNDLLQIDWVANFASMKDFHIFSMADNHLMAEYKGGREWWVVGTVKEPQSVYLPQWDGGTK